MIIHRKCKPYFAYGFEISNKKSNQLFFRIVFLRHGAKRLLLHSRFFRNCLPKKGRRHIFWNQNSTISSYDAKEEAKKLLVMYTFTLNFPNGNVQTYPDEGSMRRAAQAMGGTVVAINSSGTNKIYAFQPKK